MEAAAWRYTLDAMQGAAQLKRYHGLKAALRMLAAQVKCSRLFTPLAPSAALQTRFAPQQSYPLTCMPEMEIANYLGLHPSTTFFSGTEKGVPCTWCRIFKISLQ